MLQMGTKAPRWAEICLWSLVTKGLVLEPEHTGSLPGQGSIHCPDLGSGWSTEAEGQWEL